jgi:hypothetical protein
LDYILKAKFIATKEQFYRASVHVQDIMLEYRADFKKKFKAVDGKKSRSLQ